MPTKIVWINHATFKFAETDPEKLWQAIERTHKVDCLSNLNEVIEQSARKAYHSLRQGAFETLVQ
jgi:hypothetical protein